MHNFAIMIKPFADERHDDHEPDHEDGGYGTLLLKCCETAMAFVEANENEDSKNAQKHYKDLVDICEQIDRHENGKEGDDDDGK
jgi:hypothetical protein